jgi:hypothetical protein
MMSLRGAASAAIVTAIAVFAVTYSPGNPSNDPVRKVVAQPDRPDIAKPAIGTQLAENADYPVTMFQYADQEHYITNGRSVSFQFPPRYYEHLLPRRGEAALHVNIGFDRETGEPWSFVQAGLPHMSLAEKARRRATASLSVLGTFRPQSKDLAAARAKGVIKPDAIKQGWKSCLDVFHWLGGEYCGYEMFEQCERGTADARAAQDSPFNTASIFARPDGAGGYSRIVVCNQADKHGWCRTDAPHDIVKSVTVYFGGPALCKADDVVAQAGELLRKHTLAAQ